MRENENGTDGLLEGVEIESPCPKRWAELVGDERTRYCGECRLHVTNLSALTRSEAEAFLESRRGAERVCVTYVPQADGRPRTREEAGRAPRRSLLSMAASFALGLVGLVPFLSGCRSAEDEDTDPRPVENGGDPDPTALPPEPGCEVLGEMVLPEPVVLPPAEQEEHLVGRIASPMPPEERRLLGTVAPPPPSTKE